MAEAYRETDYSSLGPDDLEQVLLKHALFLLRGDLGEGELTSRSSSRWGSVLAPGKSKSCHPKKAYCLLDDRSCFQLDPHIWLEQVVDPNERSGWQGLWDSELARYSLNSLHERTDLVR